MPQTRQTSIKIGALIRLSPLEVVCHEFAENTFIPEHSHPDAQLVYASKGVMTVETEQGAWVVPPQNAVWVPSEFKHLVRAFGTVNIRNLYFRRSLRDTLPNRCGVIKVSPLLRELIKRLATENSEFPLSEAGTRLVSVLIDEIQSATPMPLHLPLPGDSRALRVAKFLIENPSDKRTVRLLSSTVGASPRTIERLFKCETGMSFGNWRRQLRVLCSIQLLAEGKSVDETAMMIGYESTSAFIAMYRRYLGDTPGNYFNPLN